MVNNRKRRSTRRARRGRRNRAQRGSSSVNNLPQITASGQISSTSRSIRTLIGVLPTTSTPLNAISNFVFKSVGLTNEVIVRNGHISSNVANTQLTAKFILPLGSLLMGASFCERTGQNSVISRFTRFVLHSFKISIASVSPLGKTSGELFLGMLPFYSDVEAEEFNDKDVPPESELLGIQYVRKGPAFRPLSISYRPNVRHGQLYQDLSPDTNVLGVVIQFSNYHRDSYDAFTASEFAVDVMIEARVGARSVVLGEGESQFITYGSYVLDCLTPVTHIVRTKDDTFYVGPPRTHEIGGVVPIDGCEHVYGEIL